MFRIDSLLKKIALGQLIALLLFAVTTGLLFGFSYFKYTYEKHLSDVAKSVSKTVSNHMENTGYPIGSQEPSEIQTYQDIISSASYMDGTSVWVITKDKELISYNGATQKLEFDQLPTRYTDMLNYLLKGNEVHDQTYRKIWNRNMFGVGAPIVDSGGFVVGVVLAQASFQVVISALETSMLNLTVSLLIAMAVTFLFAMIVFHIITQPLKKIQDSAGQLQRGNYRVRTNVRQSDELGKLAESIDALASRLAETEEERKELEKMRNNFISNISHELRTPVASMRASLEALCDGLVEDEEKVKRYHQAMRQDSIQLHRLIQDLLELSKLQSTGFSMNLKSVNLCQAAEDALAAVQPIADRKDVKLHQSFVCGSPCDCQIAADYDRLCQLITILLDNGIKFTPAGKSVFFLLRCSPQPVIKITDQGCGISKEDLPYIFHHFYRGKTAAGKDGSGLGLAIASQIAARHNINLEVESRPGSGTCFILTFAGPGPAPKAEPGRRSGPDSSDSPDRREDFDRRKNSPSL